MATIPVLAASGNSPTLLGHRLWEETRIAIFKQSVDDRSPSEVAIRAPARVSFGHGWVRAGAYELFAESVALHAPLLPVLSDEDPVEVLRAGGTPGLAELRLHQGTVWRWNRAVYDPAENGHVRVELRALAAGPTVEDMIANAAFAVGLTLGLAKDVDRLLPAYPFQTAEFAFYRAAQQGLDATLPWPSDDGRSLTWTPAHALCERLLPIAQRGLVEHGVDAEEASTLLAIVAARVASRQTGARFQRAALEAALRRMPRDQALRAVLAQYEERATSGEPVHGWTLDR